VAESLESLSAAARVEVPGFAAGWDDAAAMMALVRSMGAERRRLGIPVDDVAEEMGRAVTYIEDLESGRCEALAATLMRYARLLGGQLRIEFVPGQEEHRG
jgi:hypothetical protein